MIASGVLQQPAARDRLCALPAIELIRREVSRGMGLVVLAATSQAPASQLPFLPESMRLEVRPTSAPISQRVPASPATRARIDAILEPVRESIPRESTLASERSRLAALHAEPSSHHVSLAESENGDLLMACSAGTHGRVYVTTLPLDQWRSHVLHALVLRAVRATGILIVGGGRHSGTESQLGLEEWQAEQPPNAHLSMLQLSPGDAAIGPRTLSGWPFSHFSHVVFEEPWTWADFNSIDFKAAARRVENWGSVTSRVALTQTSSFWLSLSGETRVQRRRRSYAAWMSQHGEALTRAPLLIMRAACAVTVAVQHAIVDAEECPQLATPAHLAGVIEDALKARLTNGKGEHVDGLLLPTATLLYIAQSLRIAIDRPERVSVWLKEHANAASDSSLLQAATLHGSLRSLASTTAALQRCLELEATDIRSFAIGVGLACFPGVAHPPADLAVIIPRLMRSAELSPLGRALLAESVLAAAAELEAAAESQRAGMLRASVRNASGTIVSLAKQLDGTKEMEAQLLATAAMLYLDRDAALGYREPQLGRDSRIGGSGSPTPDNGFASTLQNSEQQNRRLQRQLEAALGEVAKRERYGTVLLCFAAIAVLALLAELAVRAWPNMAQLFDQRLGIKDAVGKGAATCGVGAWRLGISCVPDLPSRGLHS